MSETRVCSFAGCPRVCHAHGFCAMHAQRLHRHGDPSIGLRRLPLADRFWSKVDKSADCWVWTAHRDHNGYGRFQIDDYPRIAHRIAWELSYGLIPNGLWVLHRCDNPPCVRPEHLFLGTAADNYLDARSKNRMPLGESHPSSRLKLVQVMEIRRLGLKGLSQRQIASQFGVAQPTVGKILRREKWAHV